MKLSRKLLGRDRPPTPPGGEAGTAGDFITPAITMADALAKEAEITARLAVLEARLDLIKKDAPGLHD